MFGLEVLKTACSITISMVSAFHLQRHSKILCGAVTETYRLYLFHIDLVAKTHKLQEIVTEANLKSHASFDKTKTKNIQWI